MSEESSETKLTPKQEAFVREYLKDLNASRAARDAGYSEDTAGAMGWENLQKPEIQAAIQKAMYERAERTRIDADQVLKELARIALVDISEAFDDAGFMLPLKEIPEDVRRAVAGLEVNEIFAGEGSQKMCIGHAKKIKLTDKIRALELLGKHLRLFTERHEHSGPDGKPIETKSLSDVPDDDLDAKIKALLEKRGCG